MWKNIHCNQMLSKVRSYSRIVPPPPAYAKPVVRVSNNVAHLGSPKDSPKPRQLLSLPPFPRLPLPGKNMVASHVTAISWLKYYFNEIPDSTIQSHFNKGLVSIFLTPNLLSLYPWVKILICLILPPFPTRSICSCRVVVTPSNREDQHLWERYACMYSLLCFSLSFCFSFLCKLVWFYVGLIFYNIARIQIKPSDVMEEGARIHIPVSVAETSISKRFGVIPSGTLYPNADEIEYLQRLVQYKARWIWLIFPFSKRYFWILCICEF